MTTRMSRVDGRWPTVDNRNRDHKPNSRRAGGGRRCSPRGIASLLERSGFEVVGQAGRQAGRQVGRQAGDATQLNALVRKHRSGSFPYGHLTDGGIP
jgi:hypothetical protein